MSEENDPTSDMLAEALNNRTPRYFRASGGNAHGQTGYQDTEKFAENLMVLQECALLLGEKLDMNSVSYAYVYDSENSIGFKFDQNSNPANPEVVGVIQNQRVAMRALGHGLDEYMENGHS